MKNYSIVPTVNGQEKKFAEEDKNLSELFKKVFGRAPKSGQFYFRSQEGWNEYCTAISAYENILGVLICRSIQSGTWFPVYHYSHQGLTYNNLLSGGSTLYSYIQFE